MACFVILSPGFPANENDSTCLPAFQKFVLSLQVEYPNLNLYVITFQYPFEKKIYQWHGTKVICMGGSNKPGIQRLLNWIRVLFELRRIKKQHTIKGIISLWLTECALVGKFFSKIHSIKHYMWLIGQDAKQSNQYIKRIRPKANEVIAMSDFLGESFAKNHGIKPMMVVENGLWLKDFPKFNSGQRPYDIIGVGSLIALKNYDLFIEIIADLKHEFPDIKVGIAGIGELEASLKEKTAVLSLTNNINFLGLMEHAQILDLMQNAKIFLHTSEYEGNSTVLMEALYCGCYVFSTQSLSNRIVENLYIAKNKQTFVKIISDQLRKKDINYSPVLFNDMRDSVRKIMSLY